jgi:ABC-type transport system substrate-binding protein
MSLEVHELGKDPFAYNLEPTLVKTWERAGQTTLVLKIDEAAKWQNVPPVNGRAFTATDLAYAFEVYRKAPGQQFIYP